MGISGNALAAAKIRRATLRAVVTRADGTVEDRGIVADYHRNPFRRWALNLALAWRKRRN